jgi:hypothetical protein
MTALLKARPAHSVMYPGGTMESFIHQQKLASYRRLIAESNLAVMKNEVQHRWLLKLLADEEAKDIEPPGCHY